MNSFPLSQKYLDFINTVDNVDADFLEGTTASGKTTVGAGVKFMRMVSRSRKKLHIIASKTTGTAEKNIIQQDNGILDIHPNAKYYGNGDKDYKIPHIGWNSLEIKKQTPIFENVKNGEYVYFVHSYYAADCESSVTAVSDYGAPLTASVQAGNIFGCQFHPEKSGETGLKILRSFVALGEEK